MKRRGRYPGEYGGNCACPGVLLVRGGNLHYNRQNYQNDIKKTVQSAVNARKNIDKKSFVVYYNRGILYILIVLYREM